MNLTLALRYQEQNNNKAIILTDITSNYDSKSDSTVTTVELDKMYEIAISGTYDFTALGAANNNVGTRFVSNGDSIIDNGGSVYEVTPKVTEIERIILAVTVKDKTGVMDTKDTVDLFSEFDGPFTDQDEMIFTVTSAMLGDTADSLLVDGLYALTYTVMSRVGGTGNYQTDTLTVTILVYGQVKVAVYEKLRNLSTTYMCSDNRTKTNIAEADLCAAYLTCIENSAYLAKTEELLNMLNVLSNMVLNGSNITW
jgi:hypothetical protein